MKTQGPAAIQVSHWLAITCLTLAVAVVYANSLASGFVYDDLLTIVHNPHIAQFKNFSSAVLSSDYFKISGAENSYRPLATLSYYLLYAGFGLNPLGYHLFSILLHLISVLLVYALGLLILPQRVSALMAGLIFAVHPVLSEAVNCISYNEDLLAGLFFLLAVWLYARFGVRGYFLSLVCFLMGMLSKEMAITLPAIIVLVDAVRSEQPLVIFQKNKWLYGGYLAVSLLYLLLRFVVFDNPHQLPAPLHGSLGQRILFLPLQAFQLIRLALFPIDLSAQYVSAYPPQFLAPLNLLAVGVVSGLIAVGIYGLWRAKPVAFGLGWFFITILPVCNLIPIHNPVADRYLYLPLVGLCLLLGCLLNAALDRWPLTDRPYAHLLRVLPVAALLFLLAGATIARNRVWKDDASLWTATVKTAPNSATAHGSLGRVYAEQGRLPEAINEYRHAIALNPSSYKAYYNLGIAFERQKRLKEASQAYGQAIQNNPRFTDAYFNLANLQVRQNSLNLAAVTYEELLAVNPDDIEARHNLGVVYARLGRLEEAAAQWKMVLAQDPQNENAQRNLDQAQRMQKQPP